MQVSEQDRSADADIDLVGRLAAGDVEAAAALYDRHSARIYALARRILRNDTDAEDVVQEVFSQAWRTAGRYEAGRGSVAGWLLIMTRTRAIDRLRARQRQAADVVLDTMAGDSRAPADRIALALLAGSLRRAMDGLPVEQRLALELAYFEGLSQSEIAERLATPLGTIKTRIRAALVALRRSLRA